MSAIAVSGVTELVTNDPSVGDGSALGIVRDGALVIENDRIAWVGESSQVPAADAHFVYRRAVIPGFVDSHSHLVFAGDRAPEFEARMRGIPYDGGGISTTVTATRAATDADLRNLLIHRLNMLRNLGGTTTIEIKSGYGLDVEHEARLLRIAREFTDETTFLGAHVVPSGSDRDEYVRLVTGPMLEACTPYARWIDVFCEPASPHAFDADEARTILQAGRDAGLGLRLHGNQLAAGPGVQLAVELGAASVDHCTFLTDEDVDALADSSTVATLLPGVEFSTRSPYPDARRLIDAGVTVAIASDCNPGTCNSSSMPFMIALAVREMNMSPAEALWAATAGGARALRRDDVGVIRPGARADLLVVDGTSHVQISYAPGMNTVSRLLLDAPPTHNRTPSPT